MECTQQKEGKERSIFLLLSEFPVFHMRVFQGCIGVTRYSRRAQITDVECSVSWMFCCVVLSSLFLLIAISTILIDREMKRLSLLRWINCTHALRTIQAAK